MNGGSTPGWIKAMHRWLRADTIIMVGTTVMREGEYRVNLLVQLTDRETELFLHSVHEAATDAEATAEAIVKTLSGVGP